MEPSQSQQQRRGYVSRSPSQTPQSSEKAMRDLRLAEENMSGKHDKDKVVNVQVIVRCRPLSEDEIRLNTPAVISCNEGRREIFALQNIANKQIDKTFSLIRSQFLSFDFVKYTQYTCVYCVYLVSDLLP
ncbi:hypothetical protein RND71_005825 [Anisodus tanguticus]|uniref:Kinesin motor domain-containing protein n=1 Tax=Anisodus tanguticus TaxID=243964 RepID=A0AAE1SPS0_9SOLA|nr:hypothetical protein RND71_005825 [Anisodus tanguticus]